MTDNVLNYFTSELLFAVQQITEHPFVQLSAVFNR